MFWKRGTSNQVTPKQEVLDYVNINLHLSEDYIYLGSCKPYFTNEKKELVEMVLVLFFKHRETEERTITVYPRNVSARFAKEHSLFLQCLEWTAGGLPLWNCIFAPSPYLKEIMLEQGYRWSSEGWQPNVSEDTVKYKKALSSQKEKQEQKVIEIDFKGKKVLDKKTDS